MNDSSGFGHTPVSGGEPLPDVDRIVASSCGAVGAEAYQEAALGENPGEVEGYGISAVEQGPREVHVSEVLAPRPERVIDEDDRVRVRNTAAYPWRTICSLRMTAKDGTRMIGSGALIAPATVLTAGHCVYFHDHGGFAQEIQVIPGRDGDVHPFGFVWANRFSTVQGWIDRADSDFDYAVIHLPTDLGSRVGILGYASLAQGTLDNLLVNNAGYPGDRPAGWQAGDPPPGTTQWWNASRIADVDATKIFYTLDTYGGQSGSPIWRYESASGQRQILGIHTLGGARANSATRINARVFQNLSRWTAGT